MNKRRFLRLFFTAEVAIFSWFYIYGTNGIMAISKIRKENDEIKKQLIVKQEHIVALEKEVLAWQTEPFYKEKVAREQLQLARENEQIYCVG